MLVRGQSHGYKIYRMIAARDGKTPRADTPTVITLPAFPIPLFPYFLFYLFRLIHVLRANVGHLRAD